MCRSKKTAFQHARLTQLLDAARHNPAAFCRQYPTKTGHPQDTPRIPPWVGLFLGVRIWGELGPITAAG